MKTDFDMVQAIANEDVQTLITKDAEYGSSWRKRGGVGAFMMLARKWDRIETQCKKHNWDIFEAGAEGLSKVDGALDDLADLRAYLLLVEEYIRANYSVTTIPREYIAPDGQ